MIDHLAQLSMSTLHLRRPGILTGFCMFVLSEFHVMSSLPKSFRRCENECSSCHKTSRASSEKSLLVRARIARVESSQKDRKSRSISSISNTVGIVLEGEGMIMSRGMALYARRWTKASLGHAIAALGRHESRSHPSMSSTVASLSHASAYALSGAIASSYLVAVFISQLVAPSKPPLWRNRFQVVRARMIAVSTSSFLCCLLVWKVIKELEDEVRKTICSSRCTS